MPTICAFADLHTVDLLLYKSAKEYWFKTFPYVYSRELFSSSFGEDEFYSSLFESLCQAHQLKLAGCDIVLSGFLEAPKVSFPTKLSKSIYEVFSEIKDVYPILVNNCSIFTPEFCFSNFDIRPVENQVKISDRDEENYYANLEIFPQLMSIEIATQLDLDSSITSLIREKVRLPGHKSLVFCGSRFSGKSLFPELDCLLMLNLIRSAGIYEVKRDASASLVLSTLLSMYLKDAHIELDLESEGTVVSCASSLECMVQTEDGTSQLVQLDKNKIMVVPVAADKKVKIMVKSHDFTSEERTVSGGKVGLIFDTRENKKILVAEDMQIFSAALKEFGMAKAAVSKTTDATHAEV